MPRLLFEKTGNAVWISHLDLMRLFQRAFKRAGLPLKHTQGFNPRPSVSIALPLSVGIESRCELLDFDLDGAPVEPTAIRDGLNRSLVSGVKVLEVYDQGDKIRNLAYLDCTLTMEYDSGVPEGAAEQICQLLSREEVLVEKKNKNGVTTQNITPMILRSQITQEDANVLCIRSVVCCQNPTLNPMQIHAAVVKYLPELSPDFVRCARNEILDTKENIFR